MGVKPRKPDPEIDAAIGARLKLFRRKLGWSQQDLGAKVGLTFQQIQKYENGTSRIAASTLFHLSKIMNVPITDFYGGLDIGLPESDPMLSREEADVLRLYTQISSEDIRRSIRMMMRSFSSRQIDVPESYQMRRNVRKAEA